MPTTDVRVELSDGIAIIAPHGVIDTGCADLVGAALTSLDRSSALRVVVDVSDGVLQQRSALARLMEQLHRVVLGGTPVALVCRRLTGRQLLNRFRPTSIPVFASLGDALQAQRFAEAGYGPGWETTPTARADDSITAA
ncbi:MAG TPA: hypothetical protein VF183_04080 [Acidimicrobiales bacterium]